VEGVRGTKWAVLRRRPAPGSTHGSHGARTRSAAKRPQGAPPLHEASSEVDMQATLTGDIKGMGTFSRTGTSPLCVKKIPTSWNWVRYIHLNPMRANAVSSLTYLERYPCADTGDSGRRERKWQDRDYVLKWFGSQKRYTEFVQQGVKQGRRADLVGRTDPIARRVVGGAGHERSGDEERGVRGYWGVGSL